MDTRTVAGSSGAQLSYDVWTAGPVWTLLVHGLSSNRRTWWQVARSLAQSGVSSITVDQRSHGESEVAEDGYDFAALAADLLAVLDHANIETVTAAGQSWGASVVLDLASRAGNRVNGVVAVDGATASLQSVFPTWEDCRTALRPPDIPPMPRSTMRRYISDAHPTWSEEGVDHTLGNFRELRGKLERALPIPHHMVILEQLWNHDPVPLFDSLTIPSLLVTASERTVRAEPDEVVTMPGDHDLHVEQPAAVAALLEERSTRWAG